MAQGHHDTRGPIESSLADEDAVSSAAYVLGLLTDEDVDWLADHGEHRTLALDEVVVREGDPAPSIMLVLAGSLIATSSTATLHDESRVRGDVIGITAVVDGGPSPWTVTTVQPSVVLELENAALHSKLGLDLGFAARFYRAMALILSSRHGSASAATGEQHEPPHALEINTFVAEDRMRRLLRRVDPCDEVVLTGSDLTIEQVARVAWDRAPVAVAPAARSRLRRARDVVDRLVSGEHRSTGSTPTSASSRTSASPTPTRRRFSATSCSAMRRASAIRIRPGSCGRSWWRGSTGWPAGARGCSARCSMRCWRCSAPGCIRSCRAAARSACRTSPRWRTSRCRWWARARSK